MSVTLAIFRLSQADWESLTAVNAVGSQGLDVRAIGFDLRVQFEELVRRDLEHV